VSALGHYLEEEGIATVAISLIRPQTEKTKPPRALWVPFELGRPFGPPSDPAFQKRVILAALHVLEREKGPVLIDGRPLRIADQRVRTVCRRLAPRHGAGKPTRGVFGTADAAFRGRRRESLLP
jgi:hypothetical protein